MDQQQLTPGPQTSPQATNVMPPPTLAKLGPMESTSILGVFLNGGPKDFAKIGVLSNTGLKQPRPLAAASTGISIATLLIQELESQVLSATSMQLHQEITLQPQTQPWLSTKQYSML